MAEKDAQQPGTTEEAEQLVEANEAHPGESHQNGAAAEEADSGQAGEPGEEPTAGDDLHATVAALQQDVEKANEAALRAQAEAQNVRRRAEQEVDKARKFALEGFCRELLPVADNLERALEAATGEDASLKPISEGVELTLKTFLDAMARFNIEQINPEGEPFDPQLHQAMSTVPNGEVEPNTVVQVMQKGYTLNGRLVRPAMVMVSKAPDQQ